ncbi:MAG: UDP-N-acetylmuramoyl-tripeptide--D-alanyl-D-alanine ligase [Pseudomonadota bacterium]
MTALWTSEAAVRATGGVSSTDWVATGVSIDTRTIAKGDLFVALNGQRDGHDFVADALSKGAAAALVSRVPEGVAGNDPLLIVTDVLDALGDLGRAARKRTHAKVIGITGSVGKTSTKEMLRHLLQASGQVHASVRSYNNHWGVPLTLARMPEDTDFAVLEIGMNAPGEIAPLSRLADLDIALITTVAPVHLEAFEDVEGIAVEKASISAGLRDGGHMVVNADFPTRTVVAAQLSGLDVTWFGEAADADPIIRSISASETRQTISFLWNGLDQQFDLAATGRHFAVNALGALAVTRLAGGDVSRAMHALSTFAEPEGRGAREALNLPQGLVTLIDESYNANPTSMAAALDVLAQTEARRRVAILGDMLELGPQEVSYHVQLADLKAMSRIDIVHCVGRRMEALYKALPKGQRGEWFEDAGAAEVALGQLLLPGDALMIKGSNGSAVHRLVTALKARAEGA